MNQQNQNLNKTILERDAELRFVKEAEKELNPRRLPDQLGVKYIE